MKKSLYFLLALAAAACSTDEGVIEPSVPEVKGTPIVLSATTSDDYTKSIFDGSSTANSDGHQSFGQLLWSATDHLGIYYEQSPNSVTVDGTTIPAEKWGNFELKSGKGTSQATFTTTDMVWNPDVSQHEFYAYYPIQAGRNELNKLESPYEKAFYLSNKQDPILGADETVDQAAATNYEDYQILVAESTVEGQSATANLSMKFKPILSYLCLHVYADNGNLTENENNTENNDLSAFYANGAKIYLSRISLIANGEGTENINLSGDFTYNLNGGTYVDTEHKGSTRGINIIMPGDGLLLNKGDRKASKPVYAVMLPVDLTNAELRVNGMLTVVSADDTKHYYQIAIKDKPGTDFKPGTGYDIYVKATPTDNITDIFVNTADNTPNKGFIFRTNGQWYNFADYVKTVEVEVTKDGKTTTETRYVFDNTKDCSMMTGSDLYFIKADGTQVEPGDMKSYEAIGGLVNAIYSINGNQPVHVDMSCLKMNPGKAGTNQLKPGIFQTKDEKGDVKVDENGHPIPNLAWGSVALPEGIVKINEGAFAHCTQLETVTLPNSLSRLSKNAFLDCFALTSIVIPDYLNTHADADYRDDNNHKGFGVNTFENCRSLTYVNLPSNLEVTEVRDNVFNGCTGLKKITIPGNISTLGAGCFSGCTALSEITIRNRIAVIGTEKDTFTNVGTEVTEGTPKIIYVYKTMVQAYKDAIAAGTDGWGGFTEAKGWKVEAITDTADSASADEVPTTSAN